MPASLKACSAFLPWLRDPFCNEVMSSVHASVDGATLSPSVAEWDGVRGGVLKGLGAASGMAIFALVSKSVPLSTAAASGTNFFGSFSFSPPVFSARASSAVHSGAIFCSLAGSSAKRLQ